MFQVFQVLVGELSPLTADAPPHIVEVEVGHHILSNRNGIIEVHHSVPPSPRHKHRLPWSLDKLDDAQSLPSLGLDHLRDYLGEVVDGFILVIFAPKGLALDDELGDPLWEKHPSLMALQGGVPGRGVERVDMDSGA